MVLAVKQISFILSSYDIYDLSSSFESNDFSGKMNEATLSILLSCFYFSYFIVVLLHGCADLYITPHEIWIRKIIFILLRLMYRTIWAKENVTLSFMGNYSNVISIAIEFMFGDLWTYLIAIFYKLEVWHYDKISNLFREPFFIQVLQLQICIYLAFIVRKYTILHFHSDESFLGVRRRNRQ